MSARPYSLLRLASRTNSTQTICRRCLYQNTRLFSTSRIRWQEERQTNASLSTQTNAVSPANRSPTSVRELLQTRHDIKDTAVVNGWVQTIRKQKNFCFATVTDGSTAQTVQVVMPSEMGQSLFIGSAAKVTGSWREAAVKKGQQRELDATKVEVLGNSDPATYPLQKKAHSFEFLRSIPHLRARTSTFRSLLHLRSTSLSQISQYFTSLSFLQVQPPILTSSDCEGAGEVFAVTASNHKPFFTDPVYLTVSAQLHLEALALATSRVWCMSPTFRAEKSDTARHLNEFYMLEAEMAFMDGQKGLGKVMDVVEGVVKAIVKGIVDNDMLNQDLLSRRKGEDEMGLLAPEEVEHRWDAILNMPWKRISYTKAIDVLQQAAENTEFKFPVKWGMNLQSEHEKHLAKIVGHGAPVFVTDYPKDLKPFYMRPNADKDGEGRETVACFDLLLPQMGEIVGGSMREHRHDMLLAEMKRRGMKEEGLKQLRWYLELREWGCPPLGGFGIGFDRLLAYLAGVENIRETVAFPRWYDRCLC